MRKKAGGVIVNIIDTPATVAETLGDLRKLFKDWGIEDWEAFPEDATQAYTVRFLRGKAWTEVASRLQPTKAQNLRVCYLVARNLRIWGERGITGVAQGVSFIGGLVATGQGSDRESYEEACAVVGVDPGASWEEVRRVYLAKVQFAHPDHGGDDARFKRLQKSYEYIARVKGQNP